MQQHCCALSVICKEEGYHVYNCSGTSLALACLDCCIVTKCWVCCRLSNVFIIGKDDKPLISLPKGKGVRLDILQEQAKRDAAKA